MSAAVDGRDRQTLMRQIRTIRKLAEAMGDK